MFVLVIDLWPDQAYREFRSNRGVSHGGIDDRELRFT